MTSLTHPNRRNLQYPPNDEALRNFQWGVPFPSELPVTSSQIEPQHSDHSQYNPNERLEEDGGINNTGYSQISAIDTGFKKLKNNQIQILKELKRQYEMLKNTQLDSRNTGSKKQTSQSSQSHEDSASVSQSDAKSSVKSEIGKERRKSQQKQLRYAALQHKQVELMLNNSMRKIEELLNTEIQLRKTILELKNQLQKTRMSEGQRQSTMNKHKDQLDRLKRIIQQGKNQCDNLRNKNKELTSSIGELQGQISVGNFQIKKKQERIRALQEEVHLQKSKYFNLELDNKKSKLEIELLQRSHKQDLAIMQKRMTVSDAHLINQKNAEIRRLTDEICSKEERYKLLLNHTSKEEDKKQAHQRDYVKNLENLIQAFKQEKYKKSSSSEQALSSALQRLVELHNKPDQQLTTEVAALRHQLEEIRSHPKSKQEEQDLLERVRQLERMIEEQNVEKMYFMEDVKRIQIQYAEQRKEKEEAQREAIQLRKQLFRTEEELNKINRQFDTIRSLNVDLTESQHQNKSLMIKIQQLNIKEIQINQLREELNRLAQTTKVQIANYEEELRIIKRQLAEQQIRTYRSKEQLELKLFLNQTEHQAENLRLQEQLERVKKDNAIELNKWINQRVTLEGKLDDKNKETQKISHQINQILKQRQAIIQGHKLEADRKIQYLQEKHASEVTGLARKLEHLASISDNYAQIMSRNAFMEQQLSSVKKLLRQTRQLNEGVDHLWSIKEAQYSNIHSILKSIQ